MSEQEINTLRQWLRRNANIVWVSPENTIVKVLDVKPRPGDIVSCEDFSRAILPDGKHVALRTAKLSDFQRLEYLD